MKTQNAHILAKAALFLTALIWGSSFIMVKTVTDVMPPYFLLAFRFTGGAVILGAVFFRKLRQIDIDILWKGALIGLFLFLAYATQTIGITDTTPGKNAFLTAIYCVLVPFLYWMIGKSKPDLYNIIAAVFCMAGIGLVSLTNGLTIRFGDSFTLIGGCLYAMHMVSIATFGKGKDPILLTILQFATAALLSWGAGFTFETMPSAIPMRSVFELGYLTVFATCLCLLLQNIGQKTTSPSSAAIILSLESVFGVLFSILFYHERVTLRAMAGFLLIFVAVILSETKLSFLSGIFKNRQDKNAQDTGNASASKQSS